jgi:ornithine cyclodeaminase/alanine dehydrogenase-like protein (mu-crystallin family)
MTAPARASQLALGRRDVAALLDLDTCISAVEQAFRLHGLAQAAAPGVVSVPVPGGGFHVKAGMLDLGARYFAAKTNANFPENPARHGLPTIQGLIVLCDAERGTPLAVMDSTEITVLRTAAATAVAARHLARPDASVAAIIGCGVQGVAQLRALARVRRLARASAYDVRPDAARSLADTLAPELGIPIAVASDITQATSAADLIVTCTPSREFLLGPDAVRLGAFVAGVGVDAEHKRELEPALFAGSTVVVDVLDQCAAFGDLHHALAAGAITREAVHAELGEVVAGRKPGRTHPDEIVVFDSTGMALQDVAAAVAVYQRARERGMGTPIDFAS